MKRAAPEPFVIVKDARHGFEPRWSDDVVCQLGRLDHGHFSALGLTGHICIAALWSSADVADCVGAGLEEFKALLHGLAGYPRRCLVIVGDPGNADVRRVGSLAREHGITFAVNSDADGSTRAIEWHLRRAVQQRRAN